MDATAWLLVANLCCLAMAVLLVVAASLPWLLRPAALLGLAVANLPKLRRLRSARASRPDGEGLPPLEATARRRLRPAVYDYFAGGADDELTLAANVAAFESYWLRPRVLVDVSAVEASTIVLGQRLSMPVAVAPTAYQRLAHHQAELATVRACGTVGTAMILSTLSNTAVEQVTAAASAPVWFQLYALKDRSATDALIQRAVSAGCSAVVVTVDAPVLGNRRRDVANRFTFPRGMRLPNLAGLPEASPPPRSKGSQLEAHFAMLGLPSLTWSDIDRIKSLVSVPVILKGILTPDDARLAVEHGAAAIVVSNHGGRQLDGCLPTLNALPPVVEAVDGQLEVWLDGGVRRGTDVVKALALGARLVLVGRPVVWGLTVGGERGVVRVLDSLREEFVRALALCGCVNPDRVSPSHVARVGVHGAG